jgi:hypothetical protein
VSTQETRSKKKKENLTGKKILKLVYQLDWIGEIVSVRRTGA